ncbi:MAG: ethanolamine utilization protein EutH [Senegalia sp. (in: firmicutes)]|uniref:ethanolamine utilization protein EutH n=1 Tax=Senegalia sp. (in: firmicutes) TaxID=1924098 RepID=UPI003F9DC5B1
MSINDIILYIMVIFMVLGAIDKIIGNKFGLGEQFEEGIMAMGSLAVAMVGVISLAPVLAKILTPIVSPIYSALGADPAMFATTLLANDMGGYPLAIEMAQTPEAGLFAGLILGAMMGPTIVFTIPVALGIIKKEDHKFLATGILAGIITIPIGAFVGGLVAGFSVGMIISNLVPIIIVAALISLGLWKMPNKMIKGFTVFGRGVVIVITIGLASIIIETLTGLVIIPGMAPIWDGIEIVGSIAIVLAGAFPMVYVITKVFKKPLLKVGKLLGMNDVAAAGMVATLANNIPMFGLMKDMDNRGKIINVAFAVSASFVFGDHLGFTAGVAQDMIFPMVVGKLAGGITAVLVALLIVNKTMAKDKPDETINKGAINNEY